MKLSININKFALIRNARGQNQPNIIEIARQCLDEGSHGITVHPRPDKRHVLYEDVEDLKKLLLEYPDCELNVEGYPSDSFMDFVLETMPDQVTLVPDPPEALTSSFGWDIKKNLGLLKKKSCKTVSRKKN